MSDRARIDRPDGQEVFAKNISPVEKKAHTYYCWSIGCNAKMFPRCCGAYSAHFATLRNEKHAFPHCISRNCTYHPDPVAESLFSLDDAIRTICFATDNNIHHAKPISTRKKDKTVVGSGRPMPPHTTRMLYAACIAHGIDGSIGSVPVRDILLCREDRETYDTMLRKFCMVEVQYETKPYNMLYFYASFQTCDTATIRLRCNLSEDAFPEVIHGLSTIPDKKRKLYPMLVAAEWYPAVHKTMYGNESKRVDYECDIRKASQIFFV